MLAVGRYLAWRLASRRQEANKQAAAAQRDGCAVATAQPLFARVHVPGQVSAIDREGESLCRNGQLLFDHSAILMSRHRAWLDSLLNHRGTVTGESVERQVCLPWLKEWRRPGQKERSRVSTGHVRRDHSLCALRWHS